MKLRFSLRMLLIGTVAVAATAAFIALRSRPGRVAEQFQAAIKRGDKDAAAGMIYGMDIGQTLGLVRANSWEFISFEFSKQTLGEWLRGECLGRLVVESDISSESEDTYWSADETSQCDLVITSRGVQIVKFTQEQAIAGVPLPPYGTDNSNSSANE
jgi:hypothetical protein